MVFPPKPNMSADMPPAIASGTIALPDAPAEVVMVRVTRDMARLLARLQQLKKTEAQAIVDMGKLTVKVLGKEERFG